MAKKNKKTYRIQASPSARHDQLRILEEKTQKERDIAFWRQRVQGLVIKLKSGDGGIKELDDLKEFIERIREEDCGEKYFLAAIRVYNFYRRKLNLDYGA